MTNRAFPFSTLCFLIAASCGSSVVEFGPPRQVPAAQRPTVWDAPTRERLPVPDMGSAKKGESDPGARSWTGDTPAGWQSMPANPAGFKDAVWSVTGTDTECYFTAAVGGGVEMNLPRWYGQFGLNDVPAPEGLPAVELAGRSGRLVDIKGTFGGKQPGWQALIAFVAQGQQVTSLKFTGPEAIVTANRDKFLALAKSIRASGSAPAAGSGGTSETNHVWIGDAPAGWRSLPPNPAKFRDAVWQVAGEPDTDCYLTASVGGGVTGNLTRWYSGQFGQDVPAPEALAVIELAGRAGRLAEIKGTFAGKAGWAALIAFASRGDQVTSLKFTGPEAIVTANRDKFLALAKSLRSASASPDPKAPPIEPGQPLPPNHPSTGGSMPVDHAQPAASPFTAAAPAGWLPKAGSSRLLHHTFGSDSEVYLSQLGGTMKATLDIWRNEMSQPPMTDEQFAALPKVALLGDDAVLLDLTGKFQSMSGKQIENARLVVAARLDGTTITFCKMVGPAGEVDAQLDAFRTFCGSVRRAQ